MYTHLRSSSSTWSYTKARLYGSGSPISIRPRIFSSAFFINRTKKNDHLKMANLCKLIRLQLVFLLISFLIINIFGIITVQICLSEVPSRNGRRGESVCHWSCNWRREERLCAPHRPRLQRRKRPEQPKCIARNPHSLLLAKKPRPPCLLRRVSLLIWSRSQLISNGWLWEGMKCIRK